MSKKRTEKIWTKIIFLFRKLIEEVEN